MWTMTTHAARRRTGRAESAFEGFSALAATFRSAILSAGMRWLVPTLTTLSPGSLPPPSLNQESLFGETWPYVRIGGMPVRITDGVCWPLTGRGVRRSRCRRRSGLARRRGRISRTVSSGAACMPRSRTCTASCPAAFSASATRGERLLSMRNFTPSAGAAALARGRPRQRTAVTRGYPRR